MRFGWKSNHRSKPSTIARSTSRIAGIGIARAWPAGKNKPLPPHHESSRQKNSARPRLLPALDHRPLHFYALPRRRLALLQLLRLLRPATCDLDRWGELSATAAGRTFLDFAEEHVHLRRILGASRHG